jgi:anaerobic selenocysteine-containing dehydrogenase
MSAEDVERQGLRDGEEVVLRSDAGEGRFVVAVGPILPGNVQVVWPEGNRLIRRGVREPSSGIPAYKAVVDVIKLS